MGRQSWPARTAGPTGASTSAGSSTWSPCTRSGTCFDAFRIEGGTDRDFQSFDESIDDETLAARLSADVDPTLGAFSLAF
jgi:hypothetical protein